MTKHQLDREHVSQGSARAAEYMRIEASERPQTQSKALQKKQQATDTASLTQRFLEIERRNG